MRYYIINRWNRKEKGSNMFRIIQRAYHLLERIVRESKAYPMRKRIYGKKVANETFRDGLIPPGKSARYICTISEYVDNFLINLVQEYKEKPTQAIVINNSEKDKLPIWCCWWQGEESMPELVKLCQTRLKQVIPQDKAEMHLITLDNYAQYVDLPEHIVRKFQEGIITMTTMSDVLRFYLLEKYGGYWLDATVFFTDNIPEEYFSGQFYCQRMVSNVEYSKREACGSNWCGFSMTGPKGNIIFQFMKDAFSKWWAEYDTIIDYVLIDYMLLTGFKHVPAITEIISSVPDNNEDIFEMYKVLNQPYSEELFRRVTRRNVMHKLTYKMDLYTETAEGQLTLYGYLMKTVYENNGNFAN